MFLCLSLSAKEYRAIEAQAWQGVTKLEVSQELAFQARIWDDRLYIKLRSKQNSLRDWHRPWILKDEKFVVGKQVEDFFSLTFDGGKSIKDLWYWGANRNQWGFADDRKISEGLESPDKGLAPWRLNLQAWQIRQNPSRYLKQEPSESRADVMVQAQFSKGILELEFSRSLRSQNDDDLSLLGDVKLVISNARGLREVIELSLSQP